MKVTKKYEYPFSMVSNELLNNENISLKAKGLFAYMLSKPDSWNFTYKGMCKQLKESESAIASGIKELKDYGYITCDKQKTGHIDYWLYPETCHNIPKTSKPKTGKSHLGKIEAHSNKDSFNIDREIKRESNSENSHSDFVYKNIKETDLEQLTKDHPDKDVNAVLEKMTNYYSPETGKVLAFNQWLPKLIEWVKRERVEEQQTTEHKATEFKLDATGNCRIGYCSVCGESEFYDSFNIHKLDSECCNAKLLPKKPTPNNKYPTQTLNNKKESNGYVTNKDIKKILDTINWSSERTGT